VEITGTNQKNRWLEQYFVKYVEFVLTYKRLALSALLLMLLAFLVVVSGFRFDSSPDVFFIEGDENLIRYENFKKQFETDEFIIIVFESANPWKKEFVDDIRRLTSEIEVLKNVKKATTIVNKTYVYSDGDTIKIENYISEGKSEVDLADKKSTALIHPSFRGTYISEDGDHSSIIIETEIIKEQLDYKVELTKSIREIISQDYIRKYRPVAVGAPMLDADVLQIVQKESGFYLMVSILLVGIGFYIVFRSWVGFIIPLVLGLSGVIISMGAMAVLDMPGSLLTPIIPSYLVSVGIGSAVFLLTTYCRISGTISNRDAIFSAVVSCGPACLFSLLTTLFALLCFLLSDVQPVAHIGFALSVGLFFIFIITFTLLPIILESRLHKSLLIDSVSIDFRLKPLMVIADFVVSHYKAIVCTFVMVFVVSIYLSSQLAADYHYLGIFKDESRIRQDYKHVDDIFSASTSIEIVIQGSHEDSVKEPEFLLALDEFSEFIEKNTDIRVEIHSIVDVIKDINKVLNGDDKRFYVIPESKKLISQELLLFESSDSDEVSSIVNSDYSKTRVSIKAPNVKNSEYRKLKLLLDEGVNTYFNKLRVAEYDSQGAQLSVQTYDANVTGLIMLWLNINDYLTESQVLTTGLAFIAVSILMSLIFRSLLLGFSMGLINFSVIAFVLGMMTVLSIPLDPYTILIAAIALGVLVDDTTHFVKSYINNIEKGMEAKAAIKSCYETAGQAMSYTTIILVVSFSSYFFSNISSLNKFGLLFTITMASGLVTDYLLTPSVLLAIKDLKSLQTKPVSRLEQT
jgi:uncharacterized protein